MRVEFSNARNEYLVASVVTVRDAAGRPQFRIRCDAPWLLIRLPSGVYVVEGQRICRETAADRLTGFDRRLLQSADADRCVDDGVGRNDAVGLALSRGRLRHLERLGVATRVGRR